MTENYEMAQRADAAEMAIELLDHQPGRDSIHDLITFTEYLLNGPEPTFEQLPGVRDLTIDDDFDDWAEDFEEDDYADESMLMDWERDLLFQEEQRNIGVQRAALVRELNEIIRRAVADAA